MVVAYDANGDPYDVQTNQSVTLVFDGSGNAIDQNTGQVVDSIVMPDQTTVYQSPNATSWNQIAQQIALQATRPAQQPTYNPYYRSPYITPGATGAISASPSGIGGSLNISPTTLLLIGVVAFAFLFGKGRR